MQCVLLVYTKVMGEKYEETENESQWLLFYISGFGNNAGIDCVSVAVRCIYKLF